MLLKRFYDTRLAQASYLVGCQATGEALIIDANRDVEQYLAAATAEGMRITHVTETHIHADFLSGARELAARARARLLLSDEGGPDWRYGFAGDAGAALLKDGQTFAIGNIKVEALHTPGHTPEHLCFRITDGAATDRPMGIFTGDCIFVGDVGRPDLLERAAGHAGTMEASAHTLFRTLQKLKTLPDYLQLWPAHGAGSACGKALGAVPQTTLGYERFANWALTTGDEDAFVRLVLADQPEPPAYFAQMKRLNRDGPPPLAGSERRRPERLGAERLSEILAGGGGFVADIRRTADFAKGFVPGTTNIPRTTLPTRAGMLVPYDRPLYLLVDDGADEGGGALDEAVRDLGMIGLEVKGWFGADALAAWANGGGTLVTMPQVQPMEVVEPLAYGTVIMVDVRGRSEWDAGHLPGARHIPLPELPRRLAELPKDGQLVLHCESGSRSAVAASVLHAAGFRNVANLAGGINAWNKAGLPIEKP